jgi:hypothetical protein
MVKAKKQIDVWKPSSGKKVADDRQERSQWVGKKQWQFDI